MCPDDFSNMADGPGKVMQQPRAVARAWVTDVGSRGGLIGKKSGVGGRSPRSDHMTRAYNVRPMGSLKNEKRKGLF